MSTRTARTAHIVGHAQPEQLSLLRTSDLPVQFRLDRRTRERGLEHVAEIRRLLEAKLDPQRGRAAGAASTVGNVHHDHDQAA
ncbi:MAG: hypothetical protein JWM12_2419 [Ilumatobacteraceae bacterium]|jgi:hypothetical protein|nr:hypothetical protein [Ilumatobacteraceae bacterium]